MQGPIIFVVGIILSALVYLFALERELYILTVGVAAFGLLQLIAYLIEDKKSSENGIVTVLNDLYLMPKTMKQLAWVQFFSWFALFAMWIYTTAAVTSHVYDMNLSQQEVNDLSAATQTITVTSENSGQVEGVKEELDTYLGRFDFGETEITASMRIVKFFLDENNNSGLSESTMERLNSIQHEYNTGADWVGVSFAVYNGFAALVAFLLPVLAKYTNRKITHAISLTAGGLGLISIYFIGNPTIILVSMLGVGLAWASILAMPYAILAGALPPNKMGTYMGIFNFFIVLPQILAATILGFITKTLFEGHAIYALMLGGGTMIFAALLTFLVNDVDEVNR